MAGEGLERLGYFNGQRLEAHDYRLEQRYHIDARRMLNRGLFSPGVVSGFLVEKVPNETRKVRVRQGVALDPVGRETILLDDVLVDVPNQKPTEGPGYLLVARYSEASVEGGDPWCGGPTGAPRPARLREEVVLEWSEHAPDHRRCRSGSEGLDCGVLLALVTLTASCEVDAIFTGVREYARPTHISQVQPFSFEGEKDIDAANPKRLRFNINGVPASVRLYLWGDRFSTLYYTELGEHSHTFDKPTEPATRIDPHTHSLSDHTHEVLSSPPHRHQVLASRAALNVTGQMGALPKIGSVDTGESPAYSDHGWHWDGLKWIEQTDWPFIEDEPIPRLDSAGHPVATETSVPSLDATGSEVTGDGSDFHRHQLPATSPFGADVAARGPHGSAYGYLNNLRVGLRVGLVSTDITDSILKRLNWARLGTSNPNDLLNTEGTGEIDLLAIANENKIDLSLPGTYELTFSVKSGGGKVAYNLFVA
jgi:hypothetical protein